MKDYLNIYTLPKKAFNITFTKEGKARCNNIITFDIETSTYFAYGKNMYLSEKELIERFKPSELSESLTEEGRAHLIEYWSDRTESFMHDAQADKECGAVCYLWQFGIDDKYYYGRDLKDFKTVLDFLADKKIYCKIFVHNLSYEYFFLRGVLDFEKVFFTDRRSILYAEYNGHIFACTYKLTNLSLAAWGAQNGIEKLKTLEYDKKVRTPKTRLEREELDYGQRDLEVMYVGLKSYVDIYGDVWRIPYTQTGTLRRDIKDTFKKNVYYHNMLVNMMPKCADDLKFLKAVFSGAIVISNPENTDIILKDVMSYDKTSAYPFIQCVKKFPCTEFTIADTNTDIYKDDEKHHLYQIRFYDVQAKTAIHLLPSSKRIAAQNMKTDNGKLISADMYECFMTELDVKYFDMFYSVNKTKTEIVVHKVAESDYLDKDLVLLILDYYARKTTLKGVEGQEVYYQRGKEKLNAGYGCFATNPVKPEIYVDGYDAPDFDDRTRTDDYITGKLIEKFSKKWGEIVAYSWGIYVTSYQRFLLAEMLYKCIQKVGTSAFVYSDTDCLKGFWEKCVSLFEAENKRIEKEIREVCATRDIDFDLFQPKDQKGTHHLLGVWDYELTYAEFKTLGQKRYAFKKYKDDKKKIVDDKIYLVASGVPRTAPAPKTLDDFHDKTKWNIFKSGKKLVQYKDGDNLCVTLNAGRYDEYKVTNPCAVTMRSMSYNLSLSRAYKEVLLMYKNKKQ